ncbi:hypothetical protein A0H81_06348 [Grifola frondosa]|uniref:Uncharacterized protein n=1 Tax=Grifola frondosa TaxID=5627 RepID=A0A1C7M9K0_GRIFR|nr:hypothetical protein A0H81_06348 [Grifola frondosa]
MPGLESDDVWSLDTRGVLTLAVCKETYQSLGLVGQKLPWKGCDDTYVIQIFLHSECPDSAIKEKWHPLGVKQKASLEAWDARRGSWKIMYNYTDSGRRRICQYPCRHEPSGVDGKPMEDAIIDVRETKPIVRKTMNAHIPVPTAQPLMKGVEDLEHEEWEEKVSALFEWVGMACLGAKRLQVMDRPDPYVAVYSPPSPSRIGEFTHVRWSGLLPPGFVQSVINAASSTPLPPSSFVCITSQGVPTSPVSYLPPHRLIKTPLRAPRAESEDTWSLLFSNGGQNYQTEDNLWWALAESIGQWDMRWG